MPIRLPITTPAWPHTFRYECTQACSDYLFFFFETSMFRLLVSNLLPDKQVGLGSGQIPHHTYQYYFHIEVNDNCHNISWKLHIKNPTISEFRTMKSKLGMQYLPLTTSPVDNYICMKTSSLDWLLLTLIISLGNLERTKRVFVNRRHRTVQEVTGGMKYYRRGHSTGAGRQRSIALTVLQWGPKMLSSQCKLTPWMVGVTRCPQDLYLTYGRMFKR